MSKVDIVISTKDRAGELGVLLTSLIHQTFKDWTLIIIDDSQQSITNCEFLMKLVNRLKLDDHRLIIERASVSNENCASRQQGADLGKSPYILRVDDDVFFTKNDDLQRLVDKIDEGWDMVGGVTPPVGHPEFERSTEFVKPLMDCITFDGEGNVSMTDNCGYSYLQDECIPSNHLRSSFLYKRAIHDAGVRFDVPGRVAFREETKFCLDAAWKGFSKFCVITGVKFHHFHTSSGGCRLPPAEYSSACLFGDDFFKDWCRRMFLKHGDPYKKDEVKNVHELTGLGCSNI